MLKVEVLSSYTLIRKTTSQTHIQRQQYNYSQKSHFVISFYPFWSLGLVSEINFTLDSNMQDALKIFVSTHSVRVSCFASKAYRKCAESVAFLCPVWSRQTAHELSLLHCSATQEPIPTRDCVAYSTVGCEVPYSGVGMIFHLFYSQVKCRALGPPLPDVYPSSTGIHTGFMV